MDKYEYLEELKKLLEEAYEEHGLALDRDDREMAQYYKGRFHALNTVILMSISWG